MSNQVNLWSHLSQEIQQELIKLADVLGTETIYIWRRPHYQRRNSEILTKYQKLRSNTSQTNKEIYQQIASEMALGDISPKVVEHIVTRYSPNT